MVQVLLNCPPLLNGSQALVVAHFLRRTILGEVPIGSYLVSSGPVLIYAWVLSADCQRGVVERGEVIPPSLRIPPT